MKKLTTIILFITTLIITTLSYSTTTNYANFASSNYVSHIPLSLQVDGKVVACEVPPILYKNFTIVPIRNIAQSIGAYITWVPEISEVSLYIEETSINMRTNSMIAVVNGQNYSMPISPQIIDGRLMIPVRFISDALGLKVNWNANNRTVNIIQNYYFASSPLLSPQQSSAPLLTPISAEIPVGINKKVLAFSLGSTSSYASVVKNYNYIDEVATATHSTDAYGNISGKIPTSQLSFLSQNNIPAFVLITNNFDEKLSKKLLENPKNRKNFVNNLLTLLKSSTYKGVNIDMEYIAYNDRDYFTKFMSEIYSALSPLGYTVTVSLPAKTVDSKTNTWSGAYDYAKIANFADQLLLMTYDEHYLGGSPGAIAPIEWVKNVITYAKSVVPKEKIYMGLSAYGYDWSKSGNKSSSLDECLKKAKTYGVAVQMDAFTKSPYFKYKDEKGINHSVWFENEESLKYKLDIVNATGIAGVGIWRLGLESNYYCASIANYPNFAN